MHTLWKDSHHRANLYLSPYIFTAYISFVCENTEVPLWESFTYAIQYYREYIKYYYVLCIMYYAIQYYREYIKY